MSKNYNPMSQVDYMGRDMNALIENTSQEFLMESGTLADLDVAGDIGQRIRFYEEGGADMGFQGQGDGGERFSYSGKLCAA